LHFVAAVPTNSHSTVGITYAQDFQRFEE